MRNTPWVHGKHRTTFLCWFVYVSYQTQKYALLSILRKCIHHEFLLIYVVSGRKSIEICSGTNSCREGCWRRRHDDRSYTCTSLYLLPSFSTFPSYTVPFSIGSICSRHQYSSTQSMAQSMAGVDFRPCSGFSGDSNVSFTSNFNR